MQNIPFIKMNGAGNDFVIFDARSQTLHLAPDQVRKIADRSNDITHGCDQLIVIERSHKADAFMRIYNADGGEVSACGNATRCVAELLEKELHRLPVTIETKVDVLKGIKKVIKDGKEYILVDMGYPHLEWEKIPLQSPVPRSIELVKEHSGLDVEPLFVSMGNPHVIFFLSSQANVWTIRLNEIGPALENAVNVFPEGVNVSIAAIEKNGEEYIFHSRVWERGVGMTKACGTAACAMLVAANLRDSNIRKATILFESTGIVNTELDERGHVLLGGEVQEEFRNKVIL